MATKTVKKTNTQVKEVKDQIAEVTEQISEVKDQIAEASSTGFDTFKDTVKSINEFALDTADEVLIAAFTSGEKWQEVAEKAIDGSVKLMGKNQELLFATLEGVKSQVTAGTDRFKHLFSLN